MATLINFPLVDPAEKRLAHCGFKTQPEIKAAVVTEARAVNVTASLLMDSVIRNFVQRHDEPGSQHPLLRAIDRFNDAARFALADGRIDNVEQRRLQREWRNVDSLLWGEAA